MKKPKRHISGTKTFGNHDAKEKCINDRAPNGFLTGISKNKQQMAATQEEMYLR